MDSIDKKIENIIFYAPVGNLIKGFKNGGAEAGCRKTIEVLQKAEFNTILIEKPAKKSESTINGFILALDLLKVWFILLYRIATTRNKAVHVAGFYLNQIYFEWLIIKTANFFNVRTIYEIRNGGMIEAYEGGSTSYKYFMKSTMISSTNVLCQGYDYVEFLKNEFGKGSVYYPNYIMDTFVNKNLDRSTNPTIRLIYVGRVVPDKNLEFVIDVCSDLKKLYPNIVLDIIGAYEDSYYQNLISKVTTYDLSGNVVFHGRMEFKDIYTNLTKAHYFVFPSKEKREGHSNALTEAMGCGVVPIVSNAGFNASIVGDSSLVIPQFDSKLYSNRIYDIWCKGEWKMFSDYVYNRVLTNYTEAIVKNSLISTYNSLQ